MKTQQITDTILMVRPKHFGFNKQTAENNAFQVDDKTISKSDISTLAIQEFDGFVEKLRSQGIEIVVAEDSESPINTDAVFPNNWVTFHSDGTCILYPMFAPSRRTERSVGVLRTVFKEYTFLNHIDFSTFEKEDIYLEGTGSLILDRPNKIAYACLSPRTHDKAMDAFCQKMGYQKMLFTASDREDIQIYHTNVMMAIGEDFVVICMDSIKSANERADLEATFAKTGKTIIDISFDQMSSFAGNMLQVKNKDGKTFLVMSEQAFKSLTEQQIQLIKQFSGILHAPIYTIEKYGGGSARCMMAEIFY